MKKILRAAITLEDGRVVEVEGGTVHLVKTQTNGKPTARLELSAPVPAMWLKGDGGRYIRAEVEL